MFSYTQPIKEFNSLGDKKEGLREGDKLLRDEQKRREGVKAREPEWLCVMDKKEEERERRKREKGRVRVVGFLKRKHLIVELPTKPLLDSIHVYI